MPGCTQSPPTFFCPFFHVVLSQMATSHVLFVVRHLGFTMSVFGVTSHTHVFYHCINTNHQVPTIVFGLSPQFGDFLWITYEVGRGNFSQGCCTPPYEVQNQEPIPLQLPSQSLQA